VTERTVDVRVEFFGKDQHASSSSSFESLSDSSCSASLHWYKNDGTTALLPVGLSAPDPGARQKRVVKLNQPGLRGYKLINLSVFWKKGFAVYYVARAIIYLAAVGAWLAVVVEEFA